MRALIVDDEAPARARLRRMLAAHAEVEVVGEAADGDAAIALVAALRPDVVFLDVQMPEVDGFDVAASLPGGAAAPAIVFVTAHDRHALRAFDTQAVDYLLKPVDPDRLARALARLRAAPRAPVPPPPGQLLIADRGRTHVVRTAEIDWLEAADNYVVVHRPGTPLLMRRTLAALLGDLGPGFVRVHRGAAVALAAVQAIEPRGKGDAIAVLRSGARVTCSRQFAQALRERLGG